MAGSIFFIKQNDTSPELAATLQDAGGDAVNVTGAAIRFHMRSVDDGSTKVDADATIVDGSAGSVKYTWDAADTDTVGHFEAEFEVTYSGGLVETFPNAGYITVVIKDDVA